MAEKKLEEAIKAETEKLTDDERESLKRFNPVVFSNWWNGTSFT